MKHQKTYVFIFLLFLVAESSPICWPSQTKIYCFEDQPGFLQSPFYASIDESEILPDLYKHLLQLNEGAQKFDVTFDKTARRFGLVNSRREIIKQEETVVKLNVKKALHSDALSAPLFPASVSTLSKEARVSLLLLHHIYNAETSPFKDFLRAFKLVESIPYALRLSASLMELLSGDQIHKEVLKTRESIVGNWEQSKVEIETWTAEMKEAILGKEREKIPLSDWVFAETFVRRKSWNMGNALFLVPGACFAGYNLTIKSDGEFNEVQSVFGSTHIKTHDNSLYWLTAHDVLFDAAITDFYGRPHYSSSLFLYNQRERNPSECVEVRVSEEEAFAGFSNARKMLLKAANVYSPVLCLYNFETSLKTIEIFLKVAGLSDAEAETCFQKLIQNPFPDPKARMMFILGECAGTGEALPIKKEEIVGRIEKIAEETDSRLKGLGEVKEEDVEVKDIVRFYLEERKGLIRRIAKRVRKNLGVVEKKAEGAKTEL